MTTIDHLPHNPYCVGSDWWEEWELSSNNFPILRCWGCSRKFIIVGDDLYGLDLKERYRMIKKRDQVIGYEVIYESL